MFAAVSIFNNKIEYVAFHDEKRVIKKYIEMCDDKDLKLTKIKRKKAEKIPNFTNLYLIRYNDTFIQNGYTEYVDMTDMMYDHIMCRDELMSILEMYDFTKKEKKAFLKVISCIDEIIDEDKSWTPSLNALKDVENDVYPYINRVRYGDRYE